MSKSQNQANSSSAKIDNDVENEDDFDAAPAAQVDAKTAQANADQAEAFIAESKTAQAPTLVEREPVDAPVEVESVEAEAQEQAEAELDAALEVEAAHDSQEVEAVESQETTPVEVDPEVEQFVEDNLKDPIEYDPSQDGEDSADEDESSIQGLVEEFQIGEGVAMGSSLCGSNTNHNDYFVYIVLVLASLGIRVRNVVGKNIADVFEQGSVQDSVVTLNARLPKELFTGPKPFIRTLTALVKTVRNPQYLNFNVALLVAPNDKRMKKVEDLDAAYTSGQVVDLVDYLQTDGDLNAVLGGDVSIIVSNNAGRPFTFNAVGDAQIPNFTYQTNSLDLIAPSLNTVARYVEFLSKSQVPVSIDPFSSFYSIGNPKSLRVAEEYEDEDGTARVTDYAMQVDAFTESYRICLMELGKPLNTLINPLFLGNKLLERTNDIDGVEVNRYDICNVSLQENETDNWSFVGSTRYTLRLEFIQSLHIDAQIDDVEEDEEDEE